MERFKEQLVRQFNDWLARTAYEERKIFFEWLTNREKPLETEKVLAVGTHQAVPYGVLSGWLAYRLDGLVWLTTLEETIDPRELNKFRAWQKQLSDEAMIEIYQRLAAFSTTIGIELEWLLDEAVRLTEPELKNIREALFLHWIALWKADQVGAYINELQLFQQWQANLSEQEYRHFNEEVFKKLAAKGLIYSPPPDLWTSPQTKQQYLADIDGVMIEHSQMMRDIIKRTWKEYRGDHE
ncbi:MAG: hypothetical protein AAF485_10255 [Chloroflexota bacterium]